MIKRSRRKGEAWSGVDPSGTNILRRRFCKFQALLLKARDITLSKIHLSTTYNKPHSRSKTESGLALYKADCFEAYESRASFLYHPRLLAIGPTIESVRPE